MRVVLHVFLFLCLALSSIAVEGSRSDMRKPNRVTATEEVKESNALPNTTLTPTPSPRVAEQALQPISPVAKPRESDPVANTSNSTAVPLQTNSLTGTHVTYYGHAFIYLTSKSGVRLALNPFIEGSLPYAFPKSLPADIVLISSEANDHSGGQHFFGVPQIFRSLTGLGANRANGIPFRGVETFRDDQGGKNLGKNAVYIIEMDNMRFCHLGTLGHALNNKQADAIGRIDILFLPIGPKQITMRDLGKIVERLQPKWIVPVTYRTAKNPDPELRELSELDLGTYPVIKTTNNEFTFNSNLLPTAPTLLIIQSP